MGILQQGYEKSFYSTLKKNRRLTFFDFETQKSIDREGGRDQSSASGVMLRIWKTRCLRAPNQTCRHGLCLPASSSWLRTDQLKMHNPVAILETHLSAAGRYPGQWVELGLNRTECDRTTILELHGGKSVALAGTCIIHELMIQYSY